MPSPASNHDPAAAAVWARVTRGLAARVDPLAYDLWLAPLRLGARSGDSLLLLAPDERVRRHVAARFTRVLRDAVHEAHGARATFALAVAGDAGSAAVRDGPADPADGGHDERAVVNPKLSFDQFVIGDCNRLAHAAALAVAELPGTAYNPLFIFGPPGVGKTHLLRSIGAYLHQYSPGCRVLATSAERFTNEFTTALQTQALKRFKDTHRTNDVLLIDDVQFLERKARTEEEFFHTFNALYDAGAQIVLTSDRTPRDLQALEERLRERFESGLVTDIRPPDLATRMTILRKRAALAAFGEIQDDGLEAIARSVQRSVRALEGALIGLVAYASLTGRPLDAALAQERLGPRAAAPPGRSAAPTIAEIQAAVATHFGLTLDELLSPTRAARVVWPRQVAMHLAREQTSASLPAIGAAFGGRNHTTVLHALSRARERVRNDADGRAAIAALTELLRADRPD